MHILPLLVIICVPNKESIHSAPARVYREPGRIHLGAVPGTVWTSTVPGYEGNEPWESLDGIEFASSGEAETAPGDDYDTALPEEVLRSVQEANGKRLCRNA